MVTSRGREPVGRRTGGRPASVTSAPADQFDGDRGAISAARAHNRFTCTVQFDFLAFRTTAMRVDNGRLISEVRLRPSLWDIACASYKDRDAKLKAWIGICEVVVQNYNDASAGEKRIMRKY